MFETSVVRAGAVAAQGRFSLLTISIIAHTAVVVGAVAASIASVDFPSTAPDEVMSAPMVFAVSIPPPLGRPDGGGPRPAPQPAQQQAPQPPQSQEVVAPTEVPDEIPLGPAAQSTLPPGDAASGTGAAGPVGVPWGVEGGVGDPDAPPATTTTPPVEDRIYQSYEVTPPVLLHKVQPRFPELGRRAGMTGVVVVRCVIDRNGHVRDPQIIKAAFPPFNTAVIDAVQQWRFKPGSHNGEAVESYLDLTVSFSLN